MRVAFVDDSQHSNQLIQLSDADARIATTCAMASRGAAAMVYSQFGAMETFYFQTDIGGHFKKCDHYVIVGLEVLTFPPYMIILSSFCVIMSQQQLSHR